MADPTEPRRRAAALQYERDKDVAPRLVAKGQGFVADQILELARSHGIPIHQDPALVSVLAQMDLDDTIPPELYLVVAEVLSFIYRAEAARRECG
jgi:flagellar biosynthesis protein